MRSSVQIVKASFILQSRSVSEILLVFLPVVSVFLMKAGGARPEIWTLVLPLVCGAPLGIMAGYDFGRMKETNVMRRIEVSGVSVHAIFWGMAFGRIVYMLCSFLMAAASGLILFRSENIFGLALQAISCAAVYPVLGLLVYRLSGNALGVLAWGTPTFALLAFPLLLRMRGFPEWVALLSPLSAVSELGAAAGGRPLSAAATWIALAGISSIALLRFSARSRKQGRARAG